MKVVVIRTSLDLNEMMKMASWSKWNSFSFGLKGTIGWEQKEEALKHLVLMLAVGLY